LGAFGGGFEWGKIYLESITLVMAYSTILLAIGGWDRMDGGG